MKNRHPTNTRGLLACSKLPIGSAFEFAPLEDSTVKIFLHFIGSYRQISDMHHEFLVVLPWLSWLSSRVNFKQQLAMRTRLSQLGSHAGDKPAIMHRFCSFRHHCYSHNIMHHICVPKLCLNHKDTEMFIRSHIFGL